MLQCAEVRLALVLVSSKQHPTRSAHSALGEGPASPHPGTSTPLPRRLDIAVDANGDIIMIVRKGTSNANAKMLKIPKSSLPSQNCSYESEL